MKFAELSACAVVGLLLCAIAPAQTVNVTAGAFLETETDAGSLFTFHFAVGDVTYSGDTGQPVGGFFTCSPYNGIGCSTSDITQIGTSGVLYVYPPSAMWSIPSSDGTITPYCWGGGSFNYVRGFHHKYDPKTGILTVTGIVAPNMSMALSTPYPECNPIGPVYTMTGTWQYAAQFVKGQGSAGIWFLSQMEIVPVF